MLKLTPIAKLSTNVMDDLLNTANNRGISADAIDFDLLSYETYYKGTSDDEWRLLIGDDLLSVTTETEMRSIIFQLRQEYQITIRPAKPAHPKFDLRFTIAADKTKSKVVANIDPSSVIPMKKGIQKWIKEAIYRKKLRAGFFIGICEGNLIQEINKMLLQIQKEGPLTKPYRMPIAECFPPVPPTDDAVILHYKKNQRPNNLIDGIRPNDLILEYIFPKAGRDGRSCNGHFIAVPDPEIKYAGYIQIDEETIRAEENEEGIRYYAITSGFVQRKEGIFTISQELRIDSASFKQTGSIEAGMDKDIYVKIKNQEHSQDAVGMGITIDVQKLNVKGTVGSNTKIKAHELTIGAQTHKKSKIDVVKDATIHLHRGNLKAKEATIEILEAGKVEADVVRIKTMVGGEVIARKVYVDTLHSNARITALELIDIERIEGNGNNLIIDPHAVQAYHEKIDALEKKLLSKTAHLKEENEAFIARQLSFREKNARIKQFHQRVLNAQKSGEKPMKADVLRVQQYKAEAEKFKEIAAEIQAKEEAIQTVQSKLDTFYDADLSACVTHHGVYNGQTKITFIDPKTRQEYTVSPEKRVTHIRLRQEDDTKRLLLES